VGIDGFSNNSLNQTCREQDYYNGAGHYVAWWMTSAQNFLEQAIADPVAPGDLMVATISGTGTSWTITLSDHSSVHLLELHPGPDRPSRGRGASAEWILEAPTVGARQASLAH